MGKRILIADDVALIRKLLRNIIVKAGYEVIGEAADGKEVVMKYRELTPDVVMMDIMMSEEMSGLDAAKEIIKIDPNAKIVMCSGVAQPSIVLEAIQAGAKDFIVKPFEQSRVVAALSNVLNENLNLAFSKYVSNRYEKGRNTFGEKLKMDLKRSIEKEEFVLFFQPYFETETGKIAGMEALIRWKKNGNLIPPNEFIPILEGTPMMVELERWIFKKVLQKLKEWKLKNLNPVQVSVNISTSTFDKPTFVNEVIGYVRELDLDPGLLNMEIKGEPFIKDFDFMKNLINKIRQSGTKISMDNFGTGYSSFPYLRDLTMDFLKIDISLIRDIYRDEKTFAIVDSIILLGHRFGIKIIAEGVEKEEQLELLKRSRCDMIQGFLLSKPLNEEEILKYLEA
jgi:EAL domain-containing protein (putative c-di-GMP-specific phosphodiesterase class I)/CheY-like chemotaxis protein